MSDENCQVEHLIEYCTAQGCVISVWDGEEWLLSRSTVTSDIIEACHCVDSDVLLFINFNGKNIAKANVCMSGLEPDERVFDYVVSEFMDTWFNVWNESNEL